MDALRSMVGLAEENEKIDPDDDSNQFEESDIESNSIVANDVGRSQTCPVLTDIMKELHSDVTNQTFGVTESKKSSAEQRLPLGFQKSPNKKFQVLKLKDPASVPRLSQSQISSNPRLFSNPSTIASTLMQPVPKHSSTTGHKSTSYAPPKPMLKGVVWPCNCKSEMGIIKNRAIRLEKAMDTLFEQLYELAKITEPTLVSSATPASSVKGLLKLGDSIPIRDKVFTLDPRDVFQCRKCATSFRSEADLFSHKNNCPMANMFQSSLSQNELQKHVDLYKFSCTNCGALFRYEQDRKLHLAKYCKVFRHHVDGLQHRSGEDELEMTPERSSLKRSHPLEIESEGDSERMESETDSSLEEVIGRRARQNKKSVPVLNPHPMPTEKEREKRYCEKCPSRKSLVPQKAGGSNYGHKWRCRDCRKWHDYVDSELQKELDMKAACAKRRKTTGLFAETSPVQVLEQKEKEEERANDPYNAPVLTPEVGSEIPLLSDSEHEEEEEIPPPTQRVTRRSVAQAKSAAAAKIKQPSSAAVIIDKQEDHSKDTHDIFDPLLDETTLQLMHPMEKRELTTDEILFQVCRFIVCLPEPSTVKELSRVFVRIKAASWMQICEDLTIDSAFKILCNEGIMKDNGGNKFRRVGGSKEELEPKLKKYGALWTEQLASSSS